jgi:hypothetical protein
MSRKTAGTATADCIRVFAPDDSDLDVPAFRLVDVPDAPLASLDTGRLRCASDYELSSPLRQAIVTARLELAESQQPNGMFRSPRGADPAPVSQLILLAAWCDQLTHDHVQKAAKTLVHAQTSDGSWSCVFGGSPDLNTTVIAYLALKIAGLAGHHPALQSARRFIWQQGGADAVDSPTRLILALFGQIPFTVCLPFRTASTESNGHVVPAAMRLLMRRRSTAPRVEMGLIRELFKAQPHAWSCPWQARPARWMASWLAT